MRGLSLRKAIGAGIIGGGGGAFVNPASVPDLLLWCEADALALNDGDAVASWTDQSGGNRHPVQATAAKKPTYKANIINGKPAVLFDGITDGTNGDVMRVGFTRNAANSVFCVFKYPTPEAGKFLFSGYLDPSMQQLGLTNTNGADITVTSGVSLVYTGAGTGQFAIWTVDFNGANSKIYKAGALVQSGNAGTGGQNGITIGANPYYAQFGNNAAACSNVYIAALIIYNRVLTDAERNNVGGWLGEKYGLNF